MSKIEKINNFQNFKKTMECPICLVNTAIEIFHEDDRHMACKKMFMIL